MPNLDDTEWPPLGRSSMIAAQNLQALGATVIQDTKIFHLPGGLQIDACADGMGM